MKERNTPEEMAEMSKEPKRWCSDRACPFYTTDQNAEVCFECGHPLELPVTAPSIDELQTSIELDSLIANLLALAESHGFTQSVFNDTRAALQSFITANYTPKRTTNGSTDELRNWFKKNVEFGEKLDISDGTIGDIESKRLWSELMALITQPTTKPYTSEEA